MYREDYASCHSMQFRNPQLSSRDPDFLPMTLHTSVTDVQHSPDKGAEIITHRSVAHFIARYPTPNAGSQYRTWWRVRRHVLKTAAFRVPASGRWRFGERA